MKRAVVFVVVWLAVLYFGDAALVRVRSGALVTMDRQVYYAIGLKGNKTEYERGGVETDEVTEQVGGVALPRVTGEGTDGTDLAVAGENDPFSGHGDEGPVDVDAEVVAKDIGSVAEEAGECGVGEGDHGR